MNWLIRCEGWLGLCQCNTADSGLIVAIKGELLPPF